MINDATPETEAERHRRTVVGLSCRCPMCAPSVVADAGAGTLTICGEQYERDADGLWWYTRERLPYSTGARWGDVLDEVARLTSALAESDMLLTGSRLALDAAASDRDEAQKQWRIATRERDEARASNREWAIQSAEWEQRADAATRRAEAEHECAERWSDFAAHQEWCRWCAEDGVASCSDGNALRERAQAADVRAAALAASRAGTAEDQAPRHTSAPSTGASA